MTERQKFQVVSRFAEFELRSYDPCAIAQIEMKTGYQSAANGAFRHLFNFISKGNSNSSPIAMTAPVIASSTSTLDSQEWRVSFVMPAGMSIQDLPVPNDARVTLIEMPRQECVALHFRGRANLNICTKKEAELRTSATAQGILLSPETRICRFDPPFKPGFLHYNEIVIPVIAPE